MEHNKIKNSWSLRDAVGENETDTTRIYGNDLLGWGVDLRQARFDSFSLQNLTETRPEEALKIPLFNFDYTTPTEDNTYPYPLIQDTIFWGENSFIRFNI